MKVWTAILVGPKQVVRRLFTPLDPRARRLRQLRQIYRADNTAGLHSRRVRDILRGVVAPTYQTHYDRLLRMERATADLLTDSIPPGVIAPDFMLHVYTLTERVVHWLDDLQRSDRLLALFGKDSAERSLIEETRQRLLARVDESLALQESIPVHLLQLSAASTGRRDALRLRETLLDLNTRLEGMAETYDDLHANLYTDLHSAQNAISKEHK